MSAISIASAQPRRPDVGLWSDVALGVSINGNDDVNQAPLCSSLALPCNSPRTFPDFGIVLQAALHAGPHVAIVAEGSTYSNYWDTVAVATTSATRVNHVSALLVGPRILMDAGESHRAFGEVLVGPQASTVSPTRFALQPGIGLDSRLSNPDWWIRTTADYSYTNGGPRNVSGIRFLLALAYTPSSVASNSAGVTSRFLRTISALR